MERGREKGKTLKKKSEIVFHNKKILGNKKRMTCHTQQYDESHR